MPRRTPERCRYCGGDLDGEAIPEKDRPAYGTYTIDELRQQSRIFLGAEVQREG